MARAGTINSKVFEIYLLQEEIDTLIAFRVVDVRGVYIQLRMIPPHPRNYQRKRIRASYITYPQKATKYDKPQRTLILLSVEDVEWIAKKVPVHVRSFIIKKEEYDPTIAQKRKPLTPTRLKLLNSTEASLRRHGSGS